MNELAVQIEGLLFALGRPLSRPELIKMTGAQSHSNIEAAIVELGTARQGGGISLVDDGKVVELRTSAAAADAVEQVRKDEYSREIGKAGLEALAAILYRGPLSRSEIDFIRGVNSSQTVRTLLMRGLVRRVPNPKDERSFLYEATTELLSQLGVSHQNQLPDYVDVKHKLRSLEEAYHEKEINNQQHAQ